jgi:hypothetical protein
VFPVLHCVNLLTGCRFFQKQRKAARRPYQTPTWESRLSHRLRTGGLTMHITTKKSVTPKFRYAQITKSRLSRRPRDMMNQSGSRPHKLSRPLGPLQVCYSCIKYFLARDELHECLMIQPFNITLLTVLPWAGPPADVLVYLFPWVEAKIAALEVHMSQLWLN